MPVEVGVEFTAAISDIVRTLEVESAPSRSRWWRWRRWTWRWAGRRARGQWPRPPVRHVAVRRQRKRILHLPIGLEGYQIDFFLSKTHRRPSYSPFSPSRDYSVQPQIGRRGFLCLLARSESARGSSSPRKNPSFTSPQAPPRWSSSGKPASPCFSPFPLHSVQSADSFGAIFARIGADFGAGIALLQVLDEAEQRNGDHRA